MPTPSNLTLPGNPRYQPKKMSVFGYDALMVGLARVELANLDVLHDIGIMPDEDYAHLTPEVREAALQITTSAVDERERAVTKHDVRAWVQLAKEQMHPNLGRWVHVPLTSYDALDTGRSLLFKEAFDLSLDLSLRDFIGVLADQVERFAETVQIGRTHGQHALPITVGFWLATCLDRVVNCYTCLGSAANGLPGKISGAVGASNALYGLGIEAEADSRGYEERVLEKLGLPAGYISTQILQPEPMGRFMFEVFLLTQALAKLADDCRHLMRTEIGEITEPFEVGQVGSSTMAHKRNPINFENVVGQGLKAYAEFQKVLLTLNSEHQRDLTASAVYRDFPILPILLQAQLDTLLRPGGPDKLPFMARIGVDEEALQRNFAMSANVVLAEPLYIILQMAGYEGDAHELVNHTLVPMAKASGRQLIEELWEHIAKNNRERQKKAADEPITDQEKDDLSLEQAYYHIPDDVRELLHYPERYTGNAAQKALGVAAHARAVIAA